jgi:two-component sensor histidine kinase
MLYPDDAIPLALLANEAMTNAFRHAFPEGSSGEVTIDLRYAPQNALILQITDNGVGMRSSNGESGLGLKLIHTFAAQLRGTLAIARPENAAGTVVTLTILRAAKRRHEPERVESNVASAMSAL